MYAGFTGGSKDTTWGGESRVHNNAQIVDLLASLDPIIAAQFLAGTNPVNTVTLWQTVGWRCAKLQTASPWWLSVMALPTNLKSRVWISAYVFARLDRKPSVGWACQVKSAVQLLLTPCVTLFAWTFGTHYHSFQPVVSVSLKCNVLLKLLKHVDNCLGSHCQCHIQLVVKVYKCSSCRLWFQRPGRAPSYFTALVMELHLRAMIAVGFTRIKRTLLLLLLLLLRQGA